MSRVVARTDPRGTLLSHAGTPKEARMVTRPQDPPRVIEEANLGLVLEAAQGAISQEFEISERLDAKIRSQIGSAAVWFAIVTGVSGTILTRSKPISDTYVDFVIAFALAAVVLLVITSWIAFGVWQLRDEKDIAPAALFEMAAAARAGELDEKLIQHYASILASRRRNNETRANAFRRSTPWCGATLAATLAQLVVVLCAAAFS